MKLIKNAAVYSPEYLGKKDVLVAGRQICKIADEIRLPQELGAETIDGTGKILIPGMIDSHVHVLGGGGEGGFANRMPETTITDLTMYGITTVVGLLGTDGIAREMTSLLAKVKGLKEKGITAYAYTGSYQIPVCTVTGNITKDIMLIEEIIGTGEVALSDHRSGQPSFDEFAKLAAQTRLGGILSGKAGIVEIHMGDGRRCLDLVEKVVEETEIPISQFLPTHVNRNPYLFESAMAFAKKGGTIDLTGNEDADYWEKVCGEVRCSKAIRRMLDAGISSDRFTISSDAQGSIPQFSPEGKFLGIGMGKSSCLLKEIRECVNRENIPLEIALKAVTSNVADVLCFKNKGRIREEYDADLCLSDKDLHIETVIAMGQIMVRDGQAVVKEVFE